MGLLEKIFGDNNTKELKRIERIVDRIEALDASMQALSDDELKAKTPEFKERLAAGETLDDLLPEAFAVCREAAYRVLGMKHFRVQLIGGVVLHEGNIAEMKTGEGKTLVATLPVYLNALTGKGVHVVTVNDYLAKRDMEWMGQVYTFLGLTVGCIIHEVSGDERRAAYAADITYGTNNEFGFDYLRDNMAIYASQQMQRELNYAIVDEVDSILIDEARTPLIISGAGSKSTDLYFKADKFVRTLRAEDDFTVDEKERSVALTEQGVSKCERYFGIENFADPDNMEINHHVIIALKAHALMKRDVDYIEKDGEIVIVDEFTGRLMFGRRYSDGLHQAIEAKEGLGVRNESRTLATITLQNYFRMYSKLAGMTGTAKTEEDEFIDIYNMQVIEIPTNRPVQRVDLDDSVYKTQRGKFRAITDEIVRRHATGQPVLVGTISVEKSEMLSEMLKKRGVPHNVLNAKQHMREAEIVAQAGKLGAVTIATNMAGRGTDIILGGHDATKDEQDAVKALGGLHIIGTERHESRRIDNQLRGRAGRQGDPGSSQFFIALDDDLMRLFGGDRIQGLMERLKLDEDTPIEAGMLSKSIENAQKQVEGRNYGIRKYVLQYDDVMNRQRSVIYSQRKRVLMGEDLTDTLDGMMKDIAGEIADYIAAGSEFPEEWDFDEMNKRIKAVNRAIPAIRPTDEEKLSLTRDKLEDLIYKDFIISYAKKEEEIGEERLRELERMILLWVVDRMWMDHIDAMDQLKAGIGLRSIGQQDPAQAYANEGGDMFEMMIRNIGDEMVKYCFAITVQTDSARKEVVSIGQSKKDEVVSAAESERRKAASADTVRPGQQIRGSENRGGEKPQPIRVAKTPGRNDPCPCGSGKKYKNCHGRNR
ncbi:MAG: preprotein translocase subunit SecA [Firmicutes bacterium]|nr:preprotein translocase subunit SecA [Bacillota bacterium]MBQ4371176.1 preprotein translocase subunit SecA [Bacillota bacterium]